MNIPTAVTIYSPKWGGPPASNMEMRMMMQNRLRNQFCHAEQWRRPKFPLTYTQNRTAATVRGRSVSVTHLQMLAATKAIKKTSAEVTDPTLTELNLVFGGGW